LNEGCDREIYSYNPILFEALKGSLPKVIWYKVTAHAQMSADLPEYFSPAAASGEK